MQAFLEIHDTRRGFLPATDPLVHLPAAFEPWERIAADLSKRLAARTVRRALAQLPACDTAELRAQPELERAMLLLSFFGHAYVWGETPPPRSLPAPVAVPWHEVAACLGRPPVLSYASYALHNWRRLDPQGPVALGNLALLQNFLGGVDEEWFVLLHVEIEAKAAPAIATLAQPSPSLPVIAAALGEMNATLQRMPERCDPYIYYSRVRPYIHGWKDQPALPGGLIYEGVSDRPQRLRGETGAQSSVVPALDAALAIEHKPDVLRDYLREMREYMPLAHRAFVEGIEQGPSLRRVALEDPSLREAYNACVRGLEEFRAKHFEYAARYIHQQAQRDSANPTEIGTGGTPFMPYLGKHLSETIEHLLPS